MVKKLNIKTDIASDEGIPIAGVGSYIQRFKDLEAGKSATKPFRPIGEEDEPPKSKAYFRSRAHKLPEKYSEDTEKDILVHYYARYGTGDCDDFDRVSGKIAASVNRLFQKKFSPDEVLGKLENKVTVADIVVDEDPVSVVTVSNTSKAPEVPVTAKVAIKLFEGEYEFIKGLEPLTGQQLDLIQFVDTDKVCFSSDGYVFFLAVKPNHIDCFDELFNFNAQETMVFEMFRDQLSDDHKARKLVLMSRLVNGSASIKKKKKAKKKAKKKVTKKVTKKTSPKVTGEKPKEEGNLG